MEKVNAEIKELEQEQEEAQRQEDEKSEKLAKRRKRRQLFVESRTPGDVFENDPEPANLEVPNSLADAMKNWGYIKDMIAARESIEVGWLKELHDECIIKHM